MSLDPVAFKKTLIYEARTAHIRGSYGWRHLEPRLRASHVNQCEPRNDVTFCEPRMRAVARMRAVCEARASCSAGNCGKSPGRAASLGSFGIIATLAERPDAPQPTRWGAVAVPKATATTESWVLDGARQSAVHSAKMLNTRDTNGLRTLARYSTTHTNTRYRY